MRIYAVDIDSIIYVENEESKKIIDEDLEESLGQRTDEINGKSIDYWIADKLKIMAIFNQMVKKLEKLKDLDNIQMHKIR